jgi:hypothetical protein
LALVALIMHRLFPVARAKLLALKLEQAMGNAICVTLYFGWAVRE